MPCENSPSHYRQHCSIRVDMEHTLLARDKGRAKLKRAIETAGCSQAYMRMSRTMLDHLEQLTQDLAQRIASSSGV